MVYIMLAEGFEEVEALTVVAIVRRAGIEANTVSITSDNEVTGAHGIVVKADEIMADVDLRNSGLVVLPGGMPGALNLRNDATLCAVLKERAEKERPIAAICAAPYILGELGILRGKKATCYPGFEDKLLGATYTAAMVERDGNIITAKGPAAAMAFGFAIVELLGSVYKANEVAEGMLYKLQ